MSTPSPYSSDGIRLRLLLDHYDEAGLHVRAGDPVCARRGERLVELSSDVITVPVFDRLLAELNGADEIVVEAATGWHRVAHEDGALITQSLVARDDVTHQDPVVEAAAGQQRHETQLDEDPPSKHELLWMAGGLLTAVAIMGACIVWSSSNTPDYDKLAPRVEQQLNDTYAEDVDVFVSRGRGESFLIVVDGEQTGCTVWNTREMWDDTDAVADVRCLGSEPWPFTPEPAGKRKQAQGKSQNG